MAWVVAASVDTVISLDAVHEDDDNAFETLEQSFEGAVESGQDCSIVQVSEPLEAAVDGLVDLDGQPAIGTQETQTEEPVAPSFTSVGVPEPEDYVEGDGGLNMSEQERVEPVEKVFAGTAVSQTSVLEKVEKKTDAATQVVEEPEQEPVKREARYTSTGVQHTSFSLGMPAKDGIPPLPVIPQSQGKDYKVDEGFKGVPVANATDAPFGEADAEDGSSQVNTSSQGQYRVEEQFEQAETYETTTDPIPTVPGYQQQQAAQSQQQSGHPHQPKAEQPPPPPPTVSTAAQTVGGPTTRYVPQAAASAQTDGSSLGGTVAASSVGHAPPTSATPTVPLGGGAPHMRPHMQLQFAQHGMMPNPGMPYAPYYPQYMAYPAQFQYGTGYGPYAGGYNHGAESAAYPAHMPPTGGPPKYGPQYTHGVTGTSVNQAAYAHTQAGLYGLGSSAYEIPGNTGTYGNKEKGDAYLPQPHQHTYPNVAGQQVPRNDVYYQQGYSQGHQGYRSHQAYQHSYTQQYGGGQYAGPPQLPPGTVQANQFNRHL